MAMPEDAGHDLGTFDMPSSKTFLPLQAVDTLLWILAREASTGIEATKERLRERINPHFISRTTSELICAGWNEKLARMPMTERQLVDAHAQVEQIDRKMHGRVREFECGAK